MKEAIEKYSAHFKVFQAFMLMLLGIIGFLYVQGQDNLRGKVAKNETELPEVKERVIRLESDFANFSKYQKSVMEKLDTDLLKIEKKLDRLLEQQR